jgi:hypothetical protein
MQNGAMDLNNAGRMVEGDHKDRPYGTLPDSVGRIVQSFKSKTTVAYIYGVRQNKWTRFHKKLWRRNYYEHIIREEDSLNRIRHYVETNPQRWELDRENPQRKGDDEFDYWLDNFKAGPGIEVQTWNR